MTWRRKRTVAAVIVIELTADDAVVRMTFLDAVRSESLCEMSC